LTAEEERLLSELNAHMAEELLGNEAFVERLLREDRGLVERILGKIKDLLSTLGRLTDPAARREHARLQKAEKLYLAAMENAGLRYVEGKIRDAVGEETERNVKHSIKYPVFDQQTITRNMEILADMDSVADIDASRLQKSGKSPKEQFAEYFASLGNNIYSPIFGDIALGKSSVKSEIRHGLTATKIASMEAIPDVLDKGYVIFHEKKQGDVERLVVCAPIKIADNPYYMGVMLQRDSQTQYLYLHNVVVEKEAPESSKTHLLTSGVKEDNEHLFITSILQKAIDVKLDK